MATDLTLDIDLSGITDESKKLAERITPGKQKFDVIVVGSGAAGGMAAYQLAMAGVKVLLPYEASFLYFANTGLSP